MNYSRKTFTKIGVGAIALIAISIFAVACGSGLHEIPITAQVANPTVTNLALLVVNLQPTTVAITTTALSPSTATTGLAYSAQPVSASGGIGPYAWSVTGAPNGLTMNAATGVLSGTPAAPGTFGLTIGVHDSSSPQQTASKGLTLTVNPQAAMLAITTIALSPSTSTVGTFYAAQALTVTGGTTPYAWSATGAPNGVTLNAATGVLSGTPTASGTFSLNVTVGDNGTPQQTISKGFTLNVSSQVAPLSVTTTALNPSTATVGTLYSSQSVTATGGNAPYSWSVTGIPNGLAMNATTGVLSGTPTVSGAFVPTVTVQDAGSPQQTNSRGFSLTVNPQLASISITTVTLSPPTATVGTAYSAQAVAASGGTPPYIWSVGSSPSGVTMNANTGVLSGTPTTSGTFSPVITVQDSGIPQQTNSKGFALTVNAQVAPISITTTGLAPSAATVGSFYSAQAVTASGGTMPYSWSATGIPNGLAMNATTGILSGTPTTSGAYSATVAVHDSGSPQQTTSRGFALTVNPQLTGPVAHFTMSASGVTPVSDPGTLTVTAVSTGSTQVTFTSTSIAGSASINSYVWRSNGTVFCATNPCTAPFSTPSNTISLTVSDVNGNTSSPAAQALLLVNPPQTTGPTSGFTMSAPGVATVNAPNPFSAGTAVGSTLTVNLSSTSVQGSSPISNYVWKDNGTQICASASCNIVLSTPANIYDLACSSLPISSDVVALTVTDQNGKSSTAQATITGTVAGPYVTFVTSPVPSLPTPQLTPMTISGINFSTSSAGGYLIFTDTISQPHSSKSFPTRITSSGSTQWIYTIDDNKDNGKWHVQMFDSNGRGSNVCPFIVQ